MNILRNQWRSPTAEQIWREHDGLSVKSILWPNIID